MSGCGTAAALAAAGGDLEAESTRKRVQRVVAVEQPLLIPLNLPELCPEGLPGHRILRVCARLLPPLVDNLRLRADAGHLDVGVHQLDR